MNEEQKTQAADNEPRYAERVLETVAGVVIRSELVPIDKVDDSCRNPCGHIGIKSDGGWLYEIVSCAVCGRGLGVA